MFETFSSAQITSFTLSHGPLQVVTSHMWATCFTHLPRLENITIERAYRSSLMEGIEDESHVLDNLLQALQASSKDERNPHCPNLHLLKLSRMTIDNALVNALTSTLEFRTSVGVPLQEIIIQGSFCREAVDAVELKAHLESLARLTIL